MYSTYSGHWQQGSMTLPSLSLLRLALMSRSDGPLCAPEPDQQTADPFLYTHGYGTGTIKRRDVDRQMGRLASKKDARPELPISG